MVGGFGKNFNISVIDKRDLHLAVEWEEYRTQNTWNTEGEVDLLRKSLFCGFLGFASLSLDSSLRNDSTLPRLRRASKSKIRSTKY